MNDHTATRTFRLEAALALSIGAGVIRTRTALPDLTPASLAALSFLLACFGVALVAALARPARAASLVDRLRASGPARFVAVVALASAIVVASTSARLGVLAFASGPLLAFAFAPALDALFSWIDARPRARDALLLVALAVALATRFDAVLLDRQPCPSISSFYVKAGHDIAERWYYTTLVYPPGYPGFMAFFVALGGGPAGAMAAQVVIDCIALVLIEATLRRIGVRPSLALVGAFVFGASTAWAIGAVTLLAEFVSPFAVIAFAAALLRAGRSERTTAWALPGAVLGLAALFRPDLLTAAAAGPLWALWRGGGARRVALRSTAFAIAVAAFLAPWGLKNRLEHGAWVFTSTSGGVSLWEGLGELPNDWGYTTADEQAEVQAMRLGQADFHSIAADRALKRAFFEGVRAHPLHEVEVVAFRWIIMVLKFPEARFDDAFEAFFLLIIVACWLSRRDPERLLVVLGPLLLGFLSIGLVHYESRYVRYVPLTHLFAAMICLEWLVATVRPPRPSSAGP